MVSRIGLRTLERIERPSVVGIHEVSFRSKFEPTRISFCPLRTSSGSRRLAFHAGNAPERNTTNMVEPTTVR